ncbi:MAG: aminoglycoside phosphotransferase family protein [Chloroflexia bacterium]|nr:aminoglycoside phosphotransferase family protein [Chloroflexia bacterium]
MRDDPGLDTAKIAASLQAGYGLDVAAAHYLPIGYDLDAAVYEAVAARGERYFLKVRFGPVSEPGLEVARALVDGGIDRVLAPLRTRSGGLWWPLEGSAGYTIVLYPFIEGENAMVNGMSEEQWRAFGTTLRAVHDSGLGERFRGRVSVEDFALPSAALVREMLALTTDTAFESRAAARFAAFWREQAARIDGMLARAEGLGAQLQRKTFDLVLCHADIHAANVMVGDDDRIHLIDWDGPKIAPRERDLLFVIGSRIARPVEAREEAWFFGGYGPVGIDPDALVYYRYERIIEDIGEIGKSVILDFTLSEGARSAAVDLAMELFVPSGDIDRAETIAFDRWPHRPT